MAAARRHSHCIALIIGLLSTHLAWVACGPARLSVPAVLCALRRRLLTTPSSRAMPLLPSLSAERPLTCSARGHC